MPLQRLRVENVRSIQHVDIDFSAAGGWRHWTVLLGENGTGKSTLLRCIALAMAGSDALAELFRDPPSWVRNGQTTSSVEVEFATRKGESRHTRLEWTSTDSISKVLRSNAENLRDIDDALAHADRNYFVAGYGSSRRLPSKDSPTLSRGEVFSTRRGQSVATLFSRDAALRPVEAWAMDLEYRRGGGGLELVKTSFDALLPGITFSRIDRDRRELIFDTPDGLVALDDLSDGYQNMAGWIGDFLFRLTETFSNYDNPLAVGGILLLDEVDLHLHPVWQRHLLKFLSDRMPEFQFVVTTHSPFTAHQSPPNALHIVQRDADGQQEVRQYQGDPRVLRIEQLLDPLLGLPTAESLKSESLKSEYRALKGQQQRDPAAEERFREVSQLVAALPDAQAISPEDQDRLALLSRVEKLLTK
jgi:predicted ATP-binding protein involved in virulence